MISYSYIVLKYIHDTSRGEAVNVGILLYSENANFIAFRARNNLSDLKKIFHGMDTAGLSKYLGNLKRGFDNKAAEISSGLLGFARPDDINDLARSVLRQDASSIQWGQVGYGVTMDLHETINELDIRYVQAAEIMKGRSARKDSDVWRTFSKELKQRNLSFEWQPKIINAGSLVEEYEYTYQNGKLHCLQPLSLDLTTAEKMHYKILAEYGKLKAIKRSPEAPDMMVYFLLGAPEERSLLGDYNSLVQFLRDEEGAEVFTEDQAPALADYLSDKIHIRSR